jgi:guanylate cyclase
LASHHVSLQPAVSLKKKKKWTADYIAAFLHPRIDNMEDMYELGLSIGDLSLHGHSRELVMTAQQHNSR